MDNLYTALNKVSTDLNNFSKELLYGSVWFPQPSLLNRIVDGGYYKARRLGYLIAIIPLSLAKGIWHGIRDAWDNFEYD